MDKIKIKGFNKDKYTIYVYKVLEDMGFEYYEDIKNLRYNKIDRFSTMRLPVTNFDYAFRVRTNNGSISLSDILTHFKITTNPIEVRVYTKAPYKISKLEEIIVPKNCKDKLELIEGFAQSSPEIQALIQAQKEKYARMAEKRKQTEKELLESMAYEESFRDTPSEEIDALLEKEIKSKEARNLGFEVDEYGEIITPEKKTPEELESMSEEELQQTIEENNKAIKKALVERILSQQRIISDQQLEISRLNSQKKEL